MYPLHYKLILVQTKLYGLMPGLNNTESSCVFFQDVHNTWEDL